MQKQIKQGLYKQINKWEEWRGESCINFRVLHFYKEKYSQNQKQIAWEWMIPEK
jgi:hypothetical protein